MRSLLRLALVVLAIVARTVALDNGLARLPPMGWMSWERYGCGVDCELDPDNCISAQLFKRQADLLVSEGYLEAGYEYVSIDDCWGAPHRGLNGELLADETRFPGGLKPLGDYLHGKRIKFGTYLDIGNETCSGYPAFNVSATPDSQADAQLKRDVEAMASWGVDSIKVDGCNADPIFMNITYPKLGKALNATGRPILYACSWPVYVGSTQGEESLDYQQFAESCNVWRVTGDIEASFDNIRGIVNYYRTANYSAGNPYGGRGEDIGKPASNYAAFQAGTRPGAYADADMILAGGTGLSIAQSELQMAMWAVWSAPLMLSIDLGAVMPDYKAVLQNKEVIAINQDSNVMQGSCVQNYVPPFGTGGRVGGGPYGQGDTIQVWMKPLADKSVAVAMLNMGTFGHPWIVNFTSADLATQGLASKKFSVRNLFRQRDEGVFDGIFKTPVQTSAVVFLKVTGMPFDDSDDVLV